MQKFDHPNILKIYDVIRTDNSTSIILEIMEAGSLSDLVKSIKVVNESLLKKIVYKVLKGLVYLHGE